MPSRNTVFANRVIFICIFSVFFPSTPDIIVFYNYFSYAVTITVGIIVVSVAIIFFVRAYNFFNRNIFTRGDNY